MPPDDDHGDGGEGDDDHGDGGEGDDDDVDKNSVGKQGRCRWSRRSRCHPVPPTATILDWPGPPQSQSLSFQLILVLCLQYIM